MIQVRVILAWERRGANVGFKGGSTKVNVHDPGACELCVRRGFNERVGMRFVC
jgi:hypothetical protein